MQDQEANKTRLSSGEDRAAKRRFAWQAFLVQLRRHRRVYAAALVLALAVGVFCISRFRCSLAVRMDGDLIGYVDSQETLDAIVERVSAAATSALGSHWIAPSLSCRLAFADATPEGEAQIARSLYETVQGACRLQLVYVDGNAVCAFPGQAEAVTALEQLRNRYITDETVSAAFCQEVTIAQGFASTSLLTDNAEILAQSVQVETEERYSLLEPYPYRTVREYDDTKYEDESQVLVKGEDGQIRVFCSRSLVNGEVLSSKVLGQEVLSEPVDEVILQGTKVRHSTGTYIWPFRETTWLSSTFGYRDYYIGSSFHRGIDLAGSYGDPVLASDGGVVIFSGVYSGYGYLVEIEHDNGDVTYYAHNSKNLVEVGDVVAQGDVIAEMGATGVASGVHVHFELHPEGGAAVDPIPYLPEEDMPPRL